MIFLKNEIEEIFSSELLLREEVLQRLRKEEVLTFVIFACYSRRWLKFRSIIRILFLISPVYRSFVFFPYQNVTVGQCVNNWTSLILNQNQMNFGAFLFSIKRNFYKVFNDCNYRKTKANKNSKKINCEIFFSNFFTQTERMRHFFSAHLKWRCA